MHRIKLLQFSLILLIPLLMGGCWDTHTLNSRSPISAIYLDQIGPQRIKMGAVFDVPGTQLPPYNGADQQLKQRHFVLYGEGRGVLDAWQTLQTLSYREVYLGQLEAIVVTERFARNDLISLLDFLGRRTEVPGNANLLVTQGDPQQLLEQKNNPNMIPGVYIQLQLSRQPLTLTNFELWRLFVTLANRTSDVHLPRIERTQGQYRVWGTALFSGSRNVGFLNEDETVFLNFLEGRREGSLTVPLNGNGSAGYILVNAKTGIQAFFHKNGGLAFQVKIAMSGALRELMPHNYRINLAKNREIEQKTAAYVQTNMIRLIAKLQRLKSDPVGFGEQVRIKYPEYWESINWHEVYPKVKVNIKIDFKLRNTGVYR